ncbi:hypothetical protein B0O99DRAFT_597894 [Bisporella sp. PMI_857]|nr:hypothetical protein B0O99DRAFT_597894 [Bisporella sp. PMI_857]
MAPNGRASQGSSSEVIEVQIVSIYHDRDEKTEEGDEDDISRGEVMDPVGCTGKDLAAFTLFSDLPSKVRLKIWRYALPAGDNGSAPFYCVSLHPVSMNSANGLVALFSFRTRLLGPLSSKTIARCTNPQISLLSACQESRTVYLAAFPLTLPAGSFPAIHIPCPGTTPEGGWNKSIPKGIIRYNKSTRIFIENLHECVAKHALASNRGKRPDAMIRLACDGGFPLQVWWSEIRHLACDFNNDYNPSWEDFKAGNMSPSTYDISSVVKCFGNLDTFTYVFKDWDNELGRLQVWDKMKEQEREEREGVGDAAMKWLAVKLVNNARQKGLMGYKLPKFVLEFGSKEGDVDDEVEEDGDDNPTHITKQLIAKILKFLME